MTNSQITGTLVTERPDRHVLEVSIAPFGVADIWTIGRTSGLRIRSFAVQASNTILGILDAVGSESI